MQAKLDLTKHSVLAVSRQIGPKWKIGRKKPKNCQTLHSNLSLPLSLSRQACISYGDHAGSGKHRGRFLSGRISYWVRCDRAFHTQFGAVYALPNRQLPNSNKNELHEI